MKSKKNAKEITKSNEKTFLKQTPIKQNDNEAKRHKLGTVLINNNRYELNLSSGIKDFQKSVKISKVYNISHEDRIFSISPYIAPNYVGQFTLDQEDQKEKTSKQIKNYKNKINHEKQNKKIALKKKIFNLKKKPKEINLEEYNKEKLRQIDEHEKQIQIEDEERQRKLKEEGGEIQKQLDDDDDNEEKLIELENKENQDIKIIEYEEIPKDSFENKIENNIEEENNRNQNYENQNQLNKNEENNKSPNKKDEEGEKEENIEKEKITLDELNILIKSAINELYLPEKVDNLVYDKAIIMIKCLSGANKRIFINGLKDGIMIKEDVNRYNIFLSKLLGKIKDDKFINQMKLKPYKEEEYPCHCKCHDEFYKEDECND